VVPGYQPPPGQPAPSSIFSNITPGYFQTLGIPILRGRSFTDADDAHAQPVAVVNQAMANKFWPKQDPIGQHFALTSKSSIPGPQIEVVGIARNGKYLSILEDERPFFYLPLAQRYLSLDTLVVRTSLPAATMLGTLRGQIAALAPGLPIFRAQTMDQSVSEGLLILQLAAALSGTLGLLGLVLGVIGVYGVVSNVVSQKTLEIGVRMAIGARPGQVRWMVLRQGFVLVAVGLALGLLLSLAAGRVVGTFLLGVSGNDPFTLAGACLLLAAVVLVACYIPAQRAMRVDPMVALKYE
jgi:predicted permease